MYIHYHRGFRVRIGQVNSFSQNEKNKQTKTPKNDRRMIDFKHVWG